MRKFIFTTCFLMFSIIGAVFAQAGAYDLSFNGTGKVITGFPGMTVVGQANALQPDGKIIAAGYYFFGADAGFAFARYNPDGSTNLSFGKDGLAKSAYSFKAGTVTIAYAFLNDMALQADGKIVFTGFALDSFGSVSFITGRLKSGGTMDSTFGVNGFVVTDASSSGGSNTACAIACQPDGKIVVGGYINTQGFVAIRYKSNGKADSSFGVHGIAKLKVGMLTNGANAMVLQSDGKIVLAGSSATALSNLIAVVRLLPDGNVDESFGVHGRVVTDIRSLGDIANCVAIAPSGKIVVGGYSNDVLYSDFALAIYNPDGSLYKKTVTDVNTYNDVANSVIVQSDGRILLGGYAENATSSLLSIVRYNPNGDLDLTFGTDGKVVTDINFSGATETGIFIQPDDKIVLTGTKQFGDTSKFATLRLLRGPVLSVTENIAGSFSMSVFPNPVDVHSTLTYKIDQASMITVSLLDVQGRVLTSFFEERRPAGEHKLDLTFPNELAAGNYWLRLSSDEGNAQIMINKQ